MNARVCFLLCLSLTACDDDDGGSTVDSGGVDVDARIDDAGAPDAAPDAAAQRDAAQEADAAEASDAAVEADAAVELDMAPPGVDAAADAATDATLEADLGRPQVECEGSADCLGFARCVEGECVPPGESELSAVVVLNEVLVDGAIDEDANGDGDVSGLDDEFVELLNIGPEPVDLGGATLVESDILGVPRHTFPEGFEMAAGEAIVVFGGGSPSEALEATPGARFFVVNASDPAFSNGLNLDDGGDTLRLLDAAGDEVFVFSYGDECADEACPPAVADQSLTRSPDGMGDFAPHAEAGEGPISPGRRSDGEPFAD